MYLKKCILVMSVLVAMMGCKDKDGVSFNQTSFNTGVTQSETYYNQSMTSVEKKMTEQGFVRQDSTTHFFTSKLQRRLKAKLQRANQNGSGTVILVDNWFIKINSANTIAEFYYFATDPDNTIEVSIYGTVYRDYRISTNTLLDIYQNIYSKEPVWGSYMAYAVNFTDLSNMFDNIDWDDLDNFDETDLGIVADHPTFVQKLQGFEKSLGFTAYANMAFADGVWFYECMAVYGYENDKGQQVNNWVSAVFGGVAAEADYISSFQESM